MSGPERVSTIPAQAIGACQRWTKGRASYRPAGELFDPSRYEVVPIDDATARRYIEVNHYSKSFPAARFRAGVVRRMPFRAEELVGCGVYSVSMNQQVIPAYFDGLDPNAGVELGRFCLDSTLAANAESWTLARMTKLLMQALPDVRGIIAYSDPLERKDENGELVKRGHVGTIYKATNAAYRGRSSARTLWLAPSGESIADRMLSKIRLGEQGERYAMAKLEQLGAPARGLREAGTDYVRRLKTESFLRPLRHPGNFAFTWDLPSPRAARREPDAGKRLSVAASIV